MKKKITTDVELVQTRVSKATAAALKRLADEDSRTVAGFLRLLIERAVEEVK
jgi:predicted DNA-binding protein